jgi:CheY-like chemotaxis protein
VAADPTQIHQILMNLCANAEHALQKKGGVIEIRLEDLEPQAGPQGPGGRPVVSLSVRDTGHGMSADVTGRIFDPFFTTKPRGEGTGLGLAVVHGIVESHGGTISVESVSGQGSTFRIHFPAIPDGGPAGVEKEEAPLSGTGRVLLVDDEEMLVNIAARMLGKLGYTVAAYADSRKALEALKSRPGEVDVVVTDLSMPGMTGPELAQEVLKIRPGLPMILCTGFNENAMQESALRAKGFSALLMKPFTLNDFSHALAAALNGLRPFSRCEASPASAPAPPKKLAAPGHLE